MACDSYSWNFWGFGGFLKFGMLARWSKRRDSTPVLSSEIWHSPPGSAQPYQEDPGRSTQLITAVPGSRQPWAVTIPYTAAGFCVSPCARPSLAAQHSKVGEHRDRSGAANPKTARPGSCFPMVVLGREELFAWTILHSRWAPRPTPQPCLVLPLPWWEYIGCC